MDAHTRSEYAIILTIMREMRKDLHELASLQRQTVHELALINQRLMKVDPEQVLRYKTIADEALAYPVSARSYRQGT